MEWQEIRKQFPALGKWTYLNTATYGQVPLRSQRAVAEYFAHRDELACTDFLTWFDDVDEIRAAIARLINCEGADISFTSTTAAALSLFLAGIDWRAGDKIVTLGNEFPNQYYYAKWLGARGVELVEMPEADSIPEGTRAVILSTVNYMSGYRPDLPRISQLARAAGALLYVDGTQSLGALRFDVAAVQPDMMACDPYKWMVSPNGATFFYISPELRARLPPAVFGWRSDKGWRSVDELHHGVPQLPDGAERYEAGMLNFPSLYALRESLRMFEEIGMDRVERRVLELAAATAEILRGAGAQVMHSNTNVVAGRFESRDGSALAKKLSEQRIVVAARHGNLRVSPHFYNDESDLDTLRTALGAM